MKKIKNIQKHLQTEIDELMNKLVSQCDKEFSLEGINGYIVNASRGLAHKDGQFTVPLWAYNKGKDYFTYYTAHELSHQLRDKSHGWKGVHDDKFYEVFKSICPKEFQFYEFNYMKK